MDRLKNWEREIDTEREREREREMHISKTFPRITSLTLWSINGYAVGVLVNTPDLQSKDTRFDWRMG